MKFKQKMSSKSILSDKIADVLTLRPKADIEDDHVFNTKPNTVSRADYSSDSEDEVAISDFRKRNVTLLSDMSKKYAGTVVSRKEFDKSSVSSLEDLNLSDYEKISKNALSDSLEEGNKDLTDSEEILADELSNKSEGTSGVEDNDESDDYSILSKQKPSKKTSDESDDKTDSEGDEEGKGYDISQMEKSITEQFEHVKKQNISEDAKKGACVRNQLLIWESLLEMRIHLQRCMNTANMMPMSDKYGELKCLDEFKEESNVTLNNVANVLDKFLALQNLLLQKFPETKSLLNKNQTEAKLKTREEIDEEIPSDSDNEDIPSDTDAEDDTVKEEKKIDTIKGSKTQKKRKLEEYESDISTSHKALKLFRDTTIQKWNEKTRLATATNIKNVPTNTILQQISYILSDRNKLIRRTQLKRSDYDIIGYKKLATSEKIQQNETEVNNTIRDRKDNDEYISEIFDDSDFYHQLLRELIECKSADISDPVQLSRQWIALQQMRSKMKRKVDTKATKGRKIKYVVHNKLVSYMAPEKSLKWNDESTNELYNSLFGKMFEHNNVGMNINLENVKIKE